MDVLTLALMCVGVSMDGMIVAMCKGLALKDVTLRSAVIVGLWFGTFHAVMPVIGYLIGQSVYDIISKIDHWILLVVLCYIGIMLIKEALSGEDEGIVSSSLSPRTMLPMSIAVSLDAMAVGITFSASGDGPVIGPLMLGIIAITMCTIGAFVGGKFGMRFGKIAGIAGGIMLIAIGIIAAIEGEMWLPRTGKSFRSKGFKGFRWSCAGQNHSEIADEGHSSTQAPQSTHLDASITATSSQVMALWGQTSTHAPHATHSDSLTVTIWIPLLTARL